VLRHFTLLTLVTLSACLAVCEDETRVGASHPHWVGDWQVSDETSLLLGFDKSDQSTFFTFPSSFHLSLDPSMTADADEHGVYRRLFSQMNHTISTSGQWKADSKEMGFTSTRCLVSKSDGGTYLWFTGGPFGIHGGKVS